MPLLLSFSAAEDWRNCSQLQCRVFRALVQQCNTVIAESSSSHTRTLSRSYLNLWLSAVLKSDLWIKHDFSIIIIII